MLGFIILILLCTVQTAIGTSLELLLETLVLDISVMIFFSVIAQTYTTDAHKTYVILGNSALIKCEIPSFVADFVSVISWVDNKGAEYFPNHIGINNNYYPIITGDTIRPM